MIYSLVCTSNDIWIRFNYEFNREIKKGETITILDKLTNKENQYLVVKSTLNMDAMNKKLIEKLKKLSKKETIQDMDELFGENPDDAYYRGCSDGEARLAEEILKEFGS